MLYINIDQSLLIMQKFAISRYVQEEIKSLSCYLSKDLVMPKIVYQMGFKKQATDDKKWYYNLYLQVEATFKATTGGSVKLIFINLLILVSFHHKPMVIQSPPQKSIHLR